MNFRQVAGKQLSWDNTGVETPFSNFSFVEGKYGSIPFSGGFFHRPESTITNLY
jgi:hypothetical protein